MRDTAIGADDQVAWNPVQVNGIGEIILPPSLEPIMCPLQLELLDAVFPLLFVAIKRELNNGHFGIGFLKGIQLREALEAIGTPHGPNV